MTIDLATGLTDYWRLDETSGPTVASIGSGSHVGTLQTGASFSTAGKINGAISLDGNVGRITCGSFAGPSGGFTCAAWINQATAATKVIASMYNNDVLDYFQFFVAADGSVTGRIYQDNVTYIGRATGAGAVTAATWCHVAMTWSGLLTNAAVKIYINGVAADTTNSGSGTFSAANVASCAFQIGAQTVVGSPNACFNGKIDEVRTYSRALDPANMAEVYIYRPAAYAIGYAPAIKLNALLPASIYQQRLIQKVLV